LSRGFFSNWNSLPKKILVSIGLYCEKIKNCGLENYELILELIDRGFKGKHIKKNLFFYRRHGNNLSVNNLESITNYGNNLVKYYGLDAYMINQYHPYLNIDNININTLKYISYIKH
jgi:hypothetical protein